MKRNMPFKLGALFGVCILLAGCAARQENEPVTVQAGVACYNQSDTFLSELIASFKEQLSAMETEELKTTVTLKDAAGSQRTQDDQVKELLDAGCNVLCVNLADRTDKLRNRKNDGYPHSHNDG